MGQVLFETQPSPQAIPWSRDDEARVTDLLRDCLREARGSWLVRLTFSGVLRGTWVVECRRNGDGRGLQLLLDPDRPSDVVSFRTALAALAASPDRPSRRARPASLPLEAPPRPEERGD
jgi:hypothetical protein